MPLVISSKEANIFEYPGTVLPVSPQVVFTGDGHGNVINRIHTLIENGIIKGITQEAYQRLIYIYQLPPKEIMREHFDEFYHLLDHAEYNTETRFIDGGDDLADRGKHDILSLLLVKILRIKGVKIEILVSNHTLEAVQCLENAAINELESDAGRVGLIKLVEFTAPRFANKDACSLSSLQIAVSRGILSQSEIVKLYTDFYRPCLRIMKIIATEENEGLFLSHAIAGLTTLEQIAMILGITYQDETLIQLISTAEAINQYFSTIAAVNCIFSGSLGDDFGEELDRSYHQKEYKPSNPFVTFFCNRSPAISRKPTHKGYPMRYAHGHCDVEYREGDAHCFNLNTSLGQAGNHQGERRSVYILPIGIALSETEWCFTERPLHPPVDLNEFATFAEGDLSVSSMIGGAQKEQKRFLGRPSITSSVGSHNESREVAQVDLVPARIAPPRNFTRLFELRTLAQANSFYQERSENGHLSASAASTNLSVSAENNVEPSDQTYLLAANGVDQQGRESPLLPLTGRFFLPHPPARENCARPLITHQSTGTQTESMDTVDAANLM